MMLKGNFAFSIHHARTPTNENARSRHYIATADTIADFHVTTFAQFIDSTQLHTPILIKRRYSSQFSAEDYFCLQILLIIF
jgi:hypothetical protein